MESLPTEILAHVFEQFSKCEICQKDCLRATKKWKSLFRCSDTCARWSKIIEGMPTYQFGCLSDFQYWEETRQLYYINHIMKTTQWEDPRARIMRQRLEQCNIGKCFPDYNEIISVTIDIKNARSLGLKVLNLKQTFSNDFLDKNGLIIHSIDQAGPVALNGKIKGSRVNRGIAGVQYTSKLNEVGQKIWVQKIKYNNNLTKLPISLIKGLDENWKGNSILQVNGIDLNFPRTFSDALQIIKDVVENPKFQTVELLINQNIDISGYIRFGCCGNYNQYPI